MGFPGFSISEAGKARVAVLLIGRVVVVAARVIARRGAERAMLSAKNMMFVI
jgi:hypothetical protein